MLTSEQQKVIRDHQIEAPVKVIPIAHAFGVRMYKNRSWVDGLSGLIRRDGEGEYSIHVNANHPITRQRFTMAHELAHFLLHKDKIGDGITDDYLYRSGLCSSIEREANLLAADILMPKHLLINEENAKLTISEQAEKFWVSTTTMDIRLGSLL